MAVAGPPPSPASLAPLGYLEEAGGHRVLVEHGTIQGHPLADQPQDLLPPVADVGAALWLTAPGRLCRLRMEGECQSREPWHAIGVTGRVGCPHQQAGPRPRVASERYPYSLAALHVPSLPPPTLSGPG